MHVAIGSGNPVKLNAVAGVVPDASATAVAVDSGVPEQPWGRAETVRGARNRAEAALSATTADYGVGIEGGVAERDDPGGVWLVMWAAVTDGSAVHFGAGPSVQLPTPVDPETASATDWGSCTRTPMGTICPTLPSGLREYALAGSRTATRTTQPSLARRLTM